jgi:hypothetical protein
VCDAWSVLPIRSRRPTRNRSGDAAGTDLCDRDLAVHNVATADRGVAEPVG